MGKAGMKLAGIFTVMAVILYSHVAFAAPYEYAPATCDFSITFPDKPFIEKKCDPAKPSACEDVVTYTQDSETSSLNFRITCKSEESAKLNSYDPADLKKTLTSMVDDEGLTPFMTDAATLKGNIKSAIASASGVRGGRDVIYVAQIWLGPASALTLESRMLGPKNQKIEDAYSDILHSVKVKDAPGSKKP